jgi:hypothetical protein
MAEKLRVQVLLTEEERERFRGCATAAGTSLSTWLREAGIEQAGRRERRQKLDTAEKLEAFFEECDEIDDGAGPESNWDDVKAMVAESKIHGLPKP